MKTLWKVFAVLALVLAVDLQAQGPFTQQIQLALDTFLTQAHSWSQPQTFTSISVDSCAGCGGGGGGTYAPYDATYITKTPNAGLLSNQAMSLLGTGLVLNATATGVQSIFAGSACTNQVATGVSAAGALTCTTVTSAYTTGLATTAGTLAQFAATTSAQLGGVISDETGSGFLVFSVSPNFTTPVLGVARATSLAAPNLLTESGSLTITPFAGQNLNVALSTTGDFVVNTTQLVVDTSAASVGIGTAAPDARLHINTNTAVTPAAPIGTGATLHLSGADTLGTSVTMDGFAQSNSIYGRRAAGTAAAPTAIQTSNIMLLVGGVGYKATGYSATSTNMTFAADEVWTDTATGSRITFTTSTVGTTTPTERLRINSSGYVGIGTTGATSRLVINGDLGLTTSTSGAGVVAISATAPTVTSAGTSPSITASNGTIAFRVNVGTGGTATTIVLAMPTATTGWNCVGNNLTAAAANTANFHVVQQSSTTTAVTLQQQTVSTGAALAFVASDIVSVICAAY